MTEGTNVAEDAAQDRHQRHEEQFKELDTRMSRTEEQVNTNTDWIWGPKGAPHRGGEARVSAVESRLSQGKLVFLQYVLPALTTALVTSGVVLIVALLT